MEPEIAESATTITKVLLTLVPVLIGGLLAIGGAFVGTLLAYILGERSKKKALKREKLEKLLSAVNKTEHWLDEYKNTKFGLYEKDIGPSPISEVKYLGKLYLKELSSEIAGLSLVSAKYFKLIASCHLEKLKTGSIPSSFINDYEPIINELTEAVSALVDRAGEVSDEI